MNEILKRHFEIKDVIDTKSDKAGADEVKKTRKVIMETVDGRKITLTGDEDRITGFISGDTIEVRITRTQTELFKVEEQEFEEVGE